MKNVMMMVLVLGGILMVDASTAKADHRFRGNGFRGNGVSLSISYGNGFNNLNYSQGRGFRGNNFGGFGQPRGVYVAPVRYNAYPVYAAPVYRGGFGGGGFGGGGFGGYRGNCR